MYHLPIVDRSTMSKWNHKVSFTHSRHEWCNLTNFYHTFFLLTSLLENATLPWGQFWERFLHKHSCTCACAKPFPKIVPMAKLDFSKLHKFSCSCFSFFSCYSVLFSCFWCIFWFSMCLCNFQMQHLWQKKISEFFELHYISMSRLLNFLSIYRVTTKIQKRELS